MEDSATYSVPGRPSVRLDGAQARQLFIHQFSSVWSEAVAATSGSERIEHYRSDTRWSACFLGPVSEWPTPPLLPEVLRRYAEARGYAHAARRIQAQRLTVDLALAGAETGIPERHGLHYSPRFEVLLEHENHPGRMYEEAWKLLMLRADLRVLVSYEPKTKNRESPLQLMERQVKAAVAEQSGVEPERLLVIIGCSDAENNSVSWRAYEFTADGSLLAPNGTAIA